MDNLIVELDYLIYRSSKLLNRQRLVLNDTSNISKLKNMDKQLSIKKKLKREKQQRISSWKSQGMVDQFNDNCETIHNRYMNTTNCDKCNILFNSNTRTRKCMEHDHKTGLFRNIVCTRCNVRIGYEDRQCNNNTRIYCLYYQYYKTNNEWLFCYNKQCNKNLRIFKKFKEVEDAVAFVVINDIIMKIENEESIIY